MKKNNGNALSKADINRIIANVQQLDMDEKWEVIYTLFSSVISELPIISVEGYDEIINSPISNTLMENARIYSIVDDINKEYINIRIVVDNIALGSKGDKTSRIVFVFDNASNIYEATIFADLYGVEYAIAQTCQASYKIHIEEGREGFLKLIKAIYDDSNKIKRYCMENQARKRREMLAEKDEKNRKALAAIEDVESICDDIRTILREGDEPLTLQPTTVICVPDKEEEYHPTTWDKIKRFFMNVF